MRIRRTLRVFVVGVASLVAGMTVGEISAQTVGNPSDEPVELIETVTETVIEALTARQAYIDEHPQHVFELLDELVSPHVDFERVSRLVLGKHGKELKAEEVVPFEEALRSTLLRAYVSVIGDPAGLRVEYLDSKMNAQADRCSIRYKFSREYGRDMIVDYRVHLKQEDWMLYDLAIDGVSFLLTYRASVAGDLQRSGIHSVVERLDARNRVYRTTSPQTLNDAISSFALLNLRI